mmetsp:Transcript_28665/g.42563  ORF Transcript_28665/g.42563 Transcript_28665/m.42563 type:complete len:82 (+) Transcript_28665:922-1167(+)
MWQCEVNESCLYTQNLTLPHNINVGKQKILCVFFFLTDVFVSTSMFNHQFQMTVQTILFHSHIVSFSMHMHISNTPLTKKT